jgi:mannobiose 2-epimerase
MGFFMGIFQRRNTATLSPIFFPLLFSCLTENAVKLQNPSGEITRDMKSISLQMRQVLDDEFKKWYPLSIDTADGGFFSDINYEWELDGKQDKMIVTQARHAWSTSNAAMFYQNDNSLLKVAAHGVEFLKTTMWDQEFGGFYNLVDRRGVPITDGGEIIKQVYGNAFAIYGLAAYYKATSDSGALNFAKEAFQWLEMHSYDPQYGGYFQFTSRDGTPLTEGYRGVPPKDQNSTIHLLESFTELYNVWQDPTLKERLHSLLRIVRDTITTDKGYMMLFFNRDWTPVSYRDSSAEIRERNYELDHVSFGHDVETAYLMLEASHALGIRNDTTTLRVAKKMVDHALANGWDNEHGGIYDGGYYFKGDDKPKIVRNTKEWWSQVEAFNSFLLMSKLFPDDKHRYYEKFCTQWNYCKTYVIDNEHGGWYWGGADIVPNIRYSPKGTIWKCNYHTSRGLINCINRLKSTMHH